MFIHFFKRMRALGQHVRNNETLFILTTTCFVSKSNFPALIASSNKFPNITVWPDILYIVHASLEEALYRSGLYGLIVFNHHHNYL